jgi:pseudaminic acid cytidylyltransferase
MTKRIAIIPARAGSKRIKNKNIINFFGKPIIHHTLEHIKNSELYDEIHVSTDSQEIVNVVEALGFKVEFLRESELADDFTPLLTVVRWVLQKYEKRGQIFDSVSIITPCSPLILSTDYQKAVELYEKHEGKNPVLSVSSFPTPVEWAFEEDQNGILKATFPELLLKRSQDIVPKYYDSGNFSVQNCAEILCSKKEIGENFLKFELPNTRAIDVDTLEDLELLKALYTLQNG